MVFHCTHAHNLHVAGIATVHVLCMYVGELLLSGLICGYKLEGTGLNPQLVPNVLYYM